jgi:hypothetical protein
VGWELVFAEEKATIDDAFNGTDCRTHTTCLSGKREPSNSERCPSTMRRFWLLASAVLVFILPCIAADAWGSAVNGVRMGIAITSGPNPEILIKVQNVDDKPFLLPFGALIGSRFYDFGFRAIVTVPSGKDRRVIYTGGPGIVAGRLDPLVLPLVPTASYSVSIPLARHFYVLDESENLETFILKRCKIRVEMDVENSVCPLYGYPNPNMSLCWQGKVVSNVLQLPK